MSKHLIRTFQERFKASGKGQLIFSFRDPSLISSLTADQLWFIEREIDNSDVFCARDFSDIDVDNCDLESLYRIGRFGAMPTVG